MSFHHLHTYITLSSVWPSDAAIAQSIQTFITYLLFARAKMLATSLLMVALAATGFAQVPAPEGYRTVYITSNVDTKYTIVPVLPAKIGNTVVVFVNPLLKASESKQLIRDFIV